MPRDSDRAPSGLQAGVPFFRLDRHHDALRPALDAAVERVLGASDFILGPELAGFEAGFADYCGVRHAIGVGNGLDALTLILRGLGIGEGHEVIVPGHTFIATWLAVDQAGALPVPVDVDAGTLNIAPSLVRAAITPRTRAVIAVHLYGRPAAMDELLEVAGAARIPVIEDAAQAHGARCGTGRPAGRRVGGVGVAAGFSFYPTKNLGALGDGGAVTTDDDALADRIRLLRNYGSKIKYQHEVAGTNSRLDELQAALLSAKLPTLDANNARRRAIAARYRHELAACPGIVLPADAGDDEPVWHLFVIRARRRDALRAALAQHGIGTLIHYPVPPHRQAVYAGRIGAAAPLPVTEQAADEVLSLPMFPEMADREVRHVIEAVTAASLAISG